MEMNRIWHMNKSWIVRLIKLVTGVVPRSLGREFHNFGFSSKKKKCDPPQKKSCEKDFK